MVANLAELLEILVVVEPNDAFSAINATVILIVYSSYFKCD